MSVSETKYSYTEDTFCILANVPLPTELAQAYLRLARPRLAEDPVLLVYADGVVNEPDWTVPLLAGSILPPALVANSALCNQGVMSRLAEGPVRAHGNVPVLHMPLADIERLVFSLPPSYSQTGILATDFCNLSCSMCMFHSQITDVPDSFKDKRRADRKRLQLSRAQMHRFLEQLPHGMPVLFSASGEYLTLPDPMDAVRHAGRLGLRPRLNTNGILLSAAYSTEFIKSGADHIIVSVDGYDAASYARHRIGGDFDKVLGNIATLRAIAKASGSDLSINVNTILFDECRSMEDTIRLFWEGKVDRLSFLAERNDYLGRTDVPLTARPPFVECFEMLNGPILLTNGLVAPCCSIAIAEWFEDFPWLESVQNDSLENILSRYRALFLDATSNFSRFCRRCHYKKNSYAYKGASPYSRCFDFSGTAPILQESHAASLWARITRFFS